MFNDVTRVSGILIWNTLIFFNCFNRLYKTNVFIIRIDLLGFVCINFWRKERERDKTTLYVP